MRSLSILLNGTGAQSAAQIGLVQLAIGNFNLSSADGARDCSNFLQEIFCLVVLV
jgi:hypothetical protein